MRIIKLDENSKQNILEDLLKRDPNHYDSYASTVQEIVDAVKTDGDKAVFEYTKRFDGADIHAGSIRVTEEEILEALALVEPSLLEVMKKAMNNIRDYHQMQVQHSWFDSKPNGTIDRKSVV